MTPSAIHDYRRRASLALALLLIGLAGMLLLLGLAANAEPRNLATVAITDAGIGTFTANSKGLKILVQCPARVVYLRGGGANGDTVDAGVNDLELDFTANPDPYPFQLAANRDLLYFRPKTVADATCTFLSP